MRTERRWQFAASMILGALMLAPGTLWSGTVGACLPPEGTFTGGDVQFTIPGIGQTTISNPTNSGFNHCEVPDPNSISPQTIRFGSMVSGNLTTPAGSQGFLLPAIQSVLIGLLKTGGGGETVPGGFDVFSTQLESMDIDFGGGVMLRIDPNPNMPSTGQTTVTNDGKGGFHIDSFFDIFTDLSLDGGRTWIPQSNGPTTMTFTATPEPGTFLLLGAGCLALAGWRRRK